MLFFSVILLVGGGVLLADWRATRGILGAGALVHALVTGQEAREVSESLGPPYYNVNRVNHLFVRLEIPSPDGGAIAVWHDIGGEREARPAERYLVRYRPQAPRQYRVVGSRYWPQLGSGTLFCLLGLSR